MQNHRYTFKWMHYLRCTVTALPHTLEHNYSCTHSKQTQSNVYTNNTSYTVLVQYADYVVLRHQRMPNRNNHTEFYTTKRSPECLMCRSFSRAQQIPCKALGRL